LAVKTLPSRGIGNIVGRTCTDAREVEQERIVVARLTGQRIICASFTGGIARKTQIGSNCSIRRTIILNWTRINACIVYEITNWSDCLANSAVS